jgi:putative PIN family toxin of toxin-antitoxin system
MPKTVLDTTVLVSAFLRPIDGGASFEFLRFARQRSFELYLSDDILDEVADTLMTQERMRQRYRYPDSAIVEFCKDLAQFGVMATDIPELRVVRDPNDDKILAYAVAAGAAYLVTRDKDLLSLARHDDILIITPEIFLHVLRGQT